VTWSNRRLGVTFTTDANNNTLIDVSARNDHTFFIPHPPTWKILDVSSSGQANPVPS